MDKKAFESKFIHNILDELILRLNSHVELNSRGEPHSTKSTISADDLQAVQSSLEYLYNLGEIQVVSDLATYHIIQQIRSSILKNSKRDSSQLQQIATIRGYIKEAHNVSENPQFLSSNLHAVHRWLVRARNDLSKAEVQIKLTEFLSPKVMDLVSELEK